MTTTEPPIAPSATGFVTPEAVVLDFAEAGLGSRALAFAIDLTVLFFIGVGFITMLAGAFRGVGETAAIVVLVIFLFMLFFGYPVICEQVWNGRTVGKAALGLRAVTVEGAPLRFRHSAIRSALGLIDFWLTAGAGALLGVLVSRRSQRLGDLAGGTIVIRSRRAVETAVSLQFRPFRGWEQYALSLNVTPLTAEQYGVVRSFLTRVNALDSGVRAVAADDLARRVGEVLRTPIPPDLHREGFLVAVAAAYQLHHRRTAGAAVAGAARPDPTSAAAQQAQATPWHEPTGWRTMTTAPVAGAWTASTPGWT